MRRSAISVYGPTLGYMLLIFILSSIPSLKAPDVGFHAIDKVSHILEYAVLGILLMRSALFKQEYNLRLFVTLSCIGILYGLFDEIHQAFVPNRFSSAWDVLADAVGVMLGLLLYRLWYKRKRTS